MNTEPLPHTHHHHPCHTISVTHLTLSTPATHFPPLPHNPHLHLHHTLFTPFHTLFTPSTQSTLSTYSIYLTQLFLPLSHTLCNSPNPLYPCHTLSTPVRHSSPQPHSLIFIQPPLSLPRTLHPCHTLLNPVLHSPPPPHTL